MNTDIYNNETAITHAVISKVGDSIETFSVEGELFVAVSGVVFPEDLFMPLMFLALNGHFELAAQMHMRKHFTDAFETFERHWRNAGHDWVYDVVRQYFVRHEKERGKDYLEWLRDTVAKIDAGIERHRG
jgi:hypothetical protein